MPEYSPIPDARTLFLEEYRQSPQFIGLGINCIATIGKNIDLRLDGFFYQPFYTLIEEPDGSLAFSDLFDLGTLMASSSIIYHSFLGPVRLTLNYFPEQKPSLVPQFSFGYVLFNDRAIR